MTTKIKMTPKRCLAALVATGGLAAGSATALAATQTTAHTGTTTAMLVTSSASAAATPGPGAAPPPAGGAGPGGLTVTGVSSRTIMTRDGSGHTVVVRVSKTTTYSEAGARVALSDVTIGEHIAVQATGAKAGATTLTARSVTIMLPQVMGRVTAVGKGSLTVRSINGATVTIKTTAATRYVKASGARVAVTALKKGVTIMAEGTLSHNGKTLTARRITIGRPPGGPGGPGAPGGPPPGGTPAP